MYLDIKEDIDRHQNEKVELIVSEICDKYGVNNNFEILRDKNIKEELIENMIRNSGLSLRKIANALEISYGSVQTVNMKIKI